MLYKQLRIFCAHSMIRKLFHQHLASVSQCLAVFGSVHATLTILLLQHRQSVARHGPLY